MLKYSVRFGFLIYLLFLSLYVSAQVKEPVSGIVISEDNGEPIDGVTIAWSNKGIGSITNSDGKFVIVLTPPYNQQDSLLFSCVGYKSRKVAINSVIGIKNTIKLETVIQDLKEVVVRPLTLKQLLDSINRHNTVAFVSPMKLDGYYRELVFTNTKCTEYSDAICSYFFDRASPKEIQLKINASRCRFEENVNKDRHDVKKNFKSDIDPNQAFRYALLSAMIADYFPDKVLADYKYILERFGDKGSDDLKITIYPKKGSKAFYRLTFILSNDFLLRSYRLEIPDNLLDKTDEMSLLWIHEKDLNLVIEVKYTSFFDHIYPSYYNIEEGEHFWGKLLGAKVDEISINKSEFIVNGINQSNNVSAFNKQDTYKKGNICNNGIAINDELLKNYTIIVPSAKDSVAIKSLSQ
ncbi:CarboxypepD_reg-like domain-containing protein [Mucilaginibacter mallensis]|uniref:CarboxypepD_reg-like domain-containing protein n=1 Tax=Mucilaginibacter mallensis TaxID=652787 RepID=A0A1H1VZG5_MUCMA|nr:carboxypeptidase-like regulatory domain-containing protein [Mucilaginibacter mallensis]SDS90267.1 CarboxypepD_reg-like domain-containing protein [Mucilaginibacter mallensis]